MTEPTYSPTTERIYARLPEFYRTYDTNNDYQFKTFISSLGDELDTINVLVARLHFVPEESRQAFISSLTRFDLSERPLSTLDYVDLFGAADLYATSDLVDPRTADDSWLPYIANILGVSLPNAPLVDQRAAVVHPSFYKGSPQSFEDSIKNLLTGTQFVQVYQHMDGAGASIYSPASEWDTLVVTRPDETPGGVDIIQEITDAGAKPAGVILHLISYAVIWDTIETLSMTWTSIESLGSWGALESTGS
jgi:hypothetical protein